MSREYRGVPVSPGIAVGPLFCYRSGSLQVEHQTIPSTQIEFECNRLAESIDYCRVAFADTRKHAEGITGSFGAKLFDAQLMLLEDELLLDEIRSSINTQLMSAETAVHTVFTTAIEQLTSRDDPVFRERAEIVQDVCRRLINHLLGRESNTIILQTPVILVASELTPSEMIHVDTTKLLGIALDEGGATSHAAILTRALGVPALVGLKTFLRENVSGTLAIINANSGKLIVGPEQETVDKYRAKIENFENFRVRLREMREFDASTADGTRIHLHANIELPVELSAVQEANADGIGLFRSEYLYLSNSTNPDEETQYIAYKSVAESLHPKPVVIRTFDLGGDKYGGEFVPHREPNPFMGYRAIRVSLTHPELFRTQLRAIARAAVAGNVSVMFPMISGLSEFRTARKCFFDVCDELDREGIPNRRDIPIGVMIEVPSAAILVDLFAREANFLSIGTNDLTQFTLAVDRSNPYVSDLYQPFHISVLRLLKSVIDAGKRNHIKVSICGELGGNSIAVALLTGMGMRHFSMSPLLIPQTKAILHTISIDECEQIARTVFSMDTSGEITEFLTKTIRKRFADLPIWFGR